MQMMDIMIRSYTQLDEQLHSGFFTYIPTSMLHYFAYDRFNWIFSALSFGLWIP